MSLNIIGGLVGMLLLFGLVVCIIGNACFVTAFHGHLSHGGFGVDVR